MLGWCFAGSASAQNDFGNTHAGEFGITAGAAHYFGDLNTRTGLKRPKPTVGVFFRKQFGNYVGARISAHYAQVGYADKLNKNEFNRLRNLDFTSNIWEIAIQGDFNFLRFEPYSTEYIFTPYVTIGLGLFTYDPYTNFRGEKIFLRNLGTEGQNSNYDGRSPYKTMAIAFPFGVGIKYNINPRMNISFEISNRLTTTDYLDDVSTTFVGYGNFPNGPSGQPGTAQLLQDRSWEVNPGFQFTEGQQRGNSKQKDQYLFAEIGISFNISTYRCPTN